MWLSILARRVIGITRQTCCNHSHANLITRIWIKYRSKEDFTFIKIDDLIRISALRKSTFYAYFQSATGTTPKQYITEKRMREALRLIKDTDMPYSRIAEDVGYNDFSTFFRNFCRMTSRSPSEYRAQMEEEKKGL